MKTDPEKKKKKTKKKKRKKKEKEIFFFKKKKKKRNEIQKKKRKKFISLNFKNDDMIIINNMTYQSRDVSAAITPAVIHSYFL